MSAEHRGAQRRALATLATSQVLGGVGVASGIAVMALLGLWCWRVAVVADRRLRRHEHQTGEWS